jgi:hypothetical protein
LRARLSLLGWKVRFMAYSEGNVDKKVGKYVGFSAHLSNDAGRRPVHGLWIPVWICGGLGGRGCC